MVDVVGLARAEQEGRDDEQSKRLPEGDHVQAEDLRHRDVPRPLEQGDNQRQEDEHCQDRSGDDVSHAVVRP